MESADAPARNANVESRSIPVSGIWRNCVRDNDSLTTTEKAVAFVISTYMDRDGFAFPSKLTIARGAGLSTRIHDSTAVSSAVEAIEAEGLLSVTRSRGRRGWAYQAVIPRRDVELGGVANSTRDGEKFHAGPKSIPHPRVEESKKAVIESPELLALEDTEEPSLTEDQRRANVANARAVLARLWGAGEDASVQAEDEGRCTDSGPDGGPRDAEGEDAPAGDDPEQAEVERLAGEIRAMLGAAD
jgi:hypothetical protein